MGLFKLRRLDQTGFHVHLLLPVLAIIAVGGIGSYLLSQSHADSLPTTTCRDYKFATSGVTGKASGKNTIATSACVGYIQTMLNGAYQAAADTKDNTNLGGYAAVANTYAKVNGVVNGTLRVDNSFGSATASRVRAFQATYQYYNTSTKKYVDLPINGTVDTNTWAALCGLSLRLNKADKGYKNHSTAQQALNDANKTVLGCRVKGNANVKVHPHVPASVVSAAKGGSTTTTAGGGRGAGGGGVSAVASVSMAASPQTITQGQSTRLSWVVQNASLCQMTGGAGWSGTMRVDTMLKGSGIQDVTPSSTTTFRLTCNGLGSDGTKTTTASVTVTVVPHGAL